MKTLIKSYATDRKRLDVLAIILLPRTCRRRFISPHCRPIIPRVHTPEREQVRNGIEIVHSCQRAYRCPSAFVYNKAGPPNSTPRIVPRISGKEEAG